MSSHWLFSRINNVIVFFLIYFSANILIEFKCISEDFSCKNWKSIVEARQFFFTRETNIAQVFLNYSGHFLEFDGRIAARGPL